MQKTSHQGCLTSKVSWMFLCLFLSMCVYLHVLDVCFCVLCLRVRVWMLLWETNSIPLQHTNTQLTNKHTHAYEQTKRVMQADLCLECVHQCLWMPCHHNQLLVMHALVPACALNQSFHCSSSTSYLKCKSVWIWVKNWVTLTCHQSAAEYEYEYDGLWYAWN